MRAIPLLLAAATLTGCMTQPLPETQLAESRAKFQELTAGKVAGSAMACLPPSLRSPAESIFSGPAPTYPS